MSQKIAEAYVEISARMDKLEADLKTAQGKFAAATGKMQQSAGGLTASMDKVRLAYSAAAAFIGGAFVSAIAGAIKSTADHLDQLDEMSVKTGVSVEMLTSLELAAKQNSVSMEKLATSIRMMYRSMYEANGGSKEAAEAYKRLGVNIKDASGNFKSGNEAFLEVADAISKIKNPAEKSALAMKVFGRAGAEMLPMLEGGRKALQGYIDEAKRLGLVHTAEDARRGAAFNDMLDAFNESLKRLRETFSMWPMEQMTKVFAILTGSDLPDATKLSVRIDQISDLQEKISEAEKRLPYYQKAAANPKREFMREYYENKLKQKNDQLRSLNNELSTLTQDYFSLESETNKPGTDDGGGGGGGTVSRFGSLKAARLKKPMYTEEDAKTIMGIAERLNPGIGQVKTGVGELIGMFPELQATIIDTSVTLQDRLVAPFGEMMTELQGQWSGTISEFIKGGQSFGDFMGNMFEDVLDAFSRMLGQMLSQWLTNQLFGSITGFSLGGGLKAGPEVASTFNARTGTSVVINAVDAQSFDDALRRNAASVTNIVYESQHYGRAS